MECNKVKLIKVLYLSTILRFLDFNQRWHTLITQVEVQIFVKVIKYRLWNVLKVTKLDVSP